MANLNVTEADHIFLLKFIRGFIVTYGYPPSVRDMTETLDLASTSPTRNRLDKLEERGWIARTPGVARGVRITKKGYSVMKAHDKIVMKSVVNGR